MIEHTNYCANISVALGDYVSDGVINTKDYAEAYKNGYRTDNIDFGELFTVEPIKFDTYNYQKIPTVTEFTVNRRQDSVVCDFRATKDFDSEFTVLESGFLYGANLPEEYYVLENVGTTYSNGEKLDKLNTDLSASISVLPYGLKSGCGTIGVRCYVKYTNGVNEYIGYSNCILYNY